MVGFSDGYCDVSYATSLLGNTKPWSSSQTSLKEDSLQWARVYIENTYTVPVDILIDEITSGLKNSNAFLANEHLTKSLFLAARDAAPELGLTEKTVEATPVKSTKKYNASYTAKWVDPFPQVTAIILSEGYYLKKGSVKTVAMVRR